MSELRTPDECGEPDIRSDICTWELGLKYYHLTREKPIKNCSSQFHSRWNYISYYMIYFKQHSRTNLLYKMVFVFLTC